MRVSTRASARTQLPFVFPERYLNYYPLDSVEIPSGADAQPPADMPAMAWWRFAETRAYPDIARLNIDGLPHAPLPNETIQQLRRAYYATVTYIDDECGRVLDALQTHNLASNTIVLFWGDHGFALGEHGLWDKNTNFAIATHVPTILRVPGMTDSGTRTRSLSSTVDFLPTLADLALGVTLPRCGEDSAEVQLCAEGVSLRPLLTRPNVPVKLATFSVEWRGLPKKKAKKKGAALRASHAGEADYADSILQLDGDADILARSDYDEGDDAMRIDGKPRLRPMRLLTSASESGPVDPPSSCLTTGCVMGYSMLTLVKGVELRYTEWVKYEQVNGTWQPDWQQTFGKELYNHTEDPAENANIYRHGGSSLLGTLRDRLRRGWRSAFLKDAVA